VPPLAIVGNLSFDLIDGAPPRVGGAPFHCGRALHAMNAHATTVARCAAEDEQQFRTGFARLGVPVRLLRGSETTTFSFSYHGDVRTGHLERLGDVWTTEEIDLPRGAWVHLGPLLRGDFAADVIAAVARGRTVSFDGQGLVRVREPGPLRLVADDDVASLLEHVSILKLAVEEAEALVGGVDIDALAALGPAEVIVTFGSRGSLVIAGGRATNVPARFVDVDPTGSGDAFSAAYLVRRAAGDRPIAAARRATALVGALLRGEVQ
jgi:sugar/nucleoside kinase (ribokinase family)